MSMAPERTYIALNAHIDLLLGSRANNLMMQMHYNILKKNKKNQMENQETEKNQIVNEYKLKEKKKSKVDYLKR